MDFGPWKFPEISMEFRKWKFPLIFPYLPYLRPAERAVSRGELRGGVRPAAQPEREAGHRGWEVTPGRGLGLSRPGISCGLTSEDEDLTSEDGEVPSQAWPSPLARASSGTARGVAPRQERPGPPGPLTSCCGFGSVGRRGS